MNNPQMSQLANELEARAEQLGERLEQFMQPRVERAATSMEKMEEWVTAKLSQRFRPKN